MPNVPEIRIVSVHCARRQPIGRLRNWLVNVCSAALLTAFFSCSLYAGLNPETGAYVFQVYSANAFHASAKAYRGSSQNWSATQDQRGVMYFANSEGLLEFDGTNWQTIPLPGSNPMVRSLAVDKGGTVYVGGVGIFGFLGADANGVRKFISLLDKVPEADRHFADVWRVLPASDGIYFSSYERIFRLNNDGIVRVWHPTTTFGNAFLALNAIYVKMPEKGLVRVATEDAQKETYAAVPGGMAFGVDAIAAAATIDSGNAVLATARHLFKLSARGVTPFNTPSDAFFAQNQIYSMLQRADGETLIGTRKGGVLALDLAGGGKPDRVISKSEGGLPDDYVTSFFADHQGGIWLTSFGGIARLNPALTHFEAPEGLRGDTLSMARQGGTFFAGSTTGLYRLNATPGEPPRFEHIEGIGESVWTITPRGGDVLAATSRALYAVKNGKARSILEVGGTVWDVSVSPRNPGEIYAATARGVFALREHGSAWERFAEVTPPGQTFSSILAADDGLVWATTRGGVWRIDFRTTPTRVERFGAGEGIPGNWVSVRPLAGHIVFTTQKGLRQYSESDKSFVPYTGLGAEFADGTRNIVNVFEDHSGNVWVTGPDYHGLLQHGSQGYKWHPAPLVEAGIQGAGWMFADDDGTIWANGEEKRLFRWDPSLAGNPDADFHVLTRKVEFSDTNKTLYGGSGPMPAVRLPYSSTALRFQFAAPFYEDPESVEYQFQLQGNDRNWSDWSPNTTKEYTHLSEGNYTFRVRARTPHGTIHGQSDISFGVTPPWYRTWWAYTIDVVLFGVVVWIAVRWRTRQLEEDKRQLENIVEERTVEIREQRDEIQVQERKSHSLLLNILPATVADELKSTGEVQPVGFDDVTVCFTDFVGFTLSSEKLAPGKLVAALNEYFTAFDEIIARYGLEKLKTIGDSYMFASGLPTRRDSHAVDAVLAALEMVEVVKRLAAKPDGTGWNIRVGLHSGPVVAGVVGIRKFAFDIWGNTVNFAARMESSGVHGRVNMSEHTHELLRGLVDCEFRGNIKIKEGRELPMYLAQDRCHDFNARYQKEFGDAPKAQPDTSADAQPVAAGASR